MKLLSDKTSGATTRNTPAKRSGWLRCGLRGNWWSTTAGYLGLLIAVLPAPAAENDKPARTAIVVENRAGEQFRDKVATFEDLLSSRVSGRGFSLISRQAVTDALQKENNEGGALDRQLNEQTSALRLAQNLGADFILLAAINSYGTEKTEFKDQNLDTINVIHTLRVGYRILDTAEGGSWAGDTATVTKQYRFTPNSATESTDVLNGLLDDAARKLAESLPLKRAVLPQVAAKPGEVSVTIACGVTDIVGQPLSVPDIRLAADGTLERGTNNLEVQLLDATVEVDGLTMGSTPTVLKMRPGFHRMRLTREGFRPWERTINAFDGQKLKVALQMSEAGYQRWKDSSAFLLQLEAGRKLTEAQVKALEGYARMLSQSGFKVDIQGKSLYDGAVIKQTVY